MHSDDCWSAVPGCERLFQPGQTFHTARAAVVAGQQRVQHDDAHWPGFDDVLQKAIVGRQMRGHRVMIGEGPLAFGTIIVIARRHVARHG